MRINHFDSMILGAIINGQGIANAVDLTHRSLRVLVAKFARNLASHVGALRLAGWRALTRTPAAMKPAVAMCPSYSALRRQRHQRWTPGVVVGPGSVGVR